MIEEIVKYRDGLIETQRRLNESYDKLIITLAGGALALSITFLKDVVQFKDVVYPKLLIISWILFVVSLAGILGEILFGIEAHKKAIKQIYDGTIHVGKVGGRFSLFSTFLHRSAAVTLVVGLVLLSIFAYLNTGEGYVREKATADSAAAPSFTTSTQAEPQSSTILGSAWKKKLGASSTAKAGE